MLKTIAWVLVGVAAGLTAATLFGRGGRVVLDAPPPSSVGTASATPSDTPAPRLAAIEAELARARDERKALSGEIAKLEQKLSATAEAPPADANDDAAAATEPQAPRGRRSGGPRFGDDPEDGDALARRVAELTAGGFAPDRAQWIAEREAKLRMDALYSRYDAARKGEAPDPRQYFASQDSLRADLGDDDYERYLSATGQPTNVGVGRVLAESPAATAGLKPGDQIVAYGGQRVFDMRELNSLTLKGSPGEPVAVDVLRDGTQVQLYVPRGPLGISGGFNSFRRGR